MPKLIPRLPSTNSHLPFGDMQNSPFYGIDIITVKQFDREQLTYIFEVAHEMYEMVSRVGSFDLLKGKFWRIYFISLPHGLHHLLPPPWSAWAVA